VRALQEDVPIAAQPFPSNIWRRILAYCAAGSTGQIVIHVKDGRPLRATFQDEERACYDSDEVVMS
jgi:hypothetical protein